MMQARDFGTVGVTTCRLGYAVLVAAPDYTEDDWEAAGQYLADAGFEIPPEPAQTTDDGHEVYECLRTQQDYERQEAAG